MAFVHKQINLVVNTIVEMLNPEKVIIFGSYAYGKPTKDSDIDLLVIVKNHDQPRFKRAREIRKHLWGKVTATKDILIYTSAEVLEWKNVKNAFITSIVNRGKVLYEKKTGFDE